MVDRLLDLKVHVQALQPAEQLKLISELFFEHISSFDYLVVDDDFLELSVLGIKHLRLPEQRKCALAGEEALSRTQDPINVQCTVYIMYTCITLLK